MRRGTAVRNVTEGFATKLRILKAIDRPIDEMSVSELCQKAGVSRPTFYHHFESKYDLLPWWGIWCDAHYTDLVGTVYSWEEAYLRSCHLLHWGRPYLVKGFQNGCPIDRFGSYPVSQNRVATLSRTVRTLTGSEPTPELLDCIQTLSHVESEQVIRLCRDGWSEPPLVTVRRFLSCVPPLLYEAIQLPAARARTQVENWRALDEVEQRLQDEGFNAADVINRALLEG